MKTHRTLTLAWPTTVLWLLTLGTGTLGGAEWQAGDRVVTAESAPLKRGTRTLATLEAQTALTVNRVEGQWVAVTADRNSTPVSGWIHARYLDRMTSPPTQARKLNRFTVRSSAGTGIRVSFPKRIEAIPENGCWQWTYAATFSCLGDADATIDRVGTKYLDRSGNTWTGSGGEWWDQEIIVPMRGANQYSSWVRSNGSNPDLRGATLVVSFSGRDAQGSAFQGQVSAQLVEGKAPPVSLSSVDAPRKDAVLALEEPARKLLAQAKTWRVDVVNDYPHDPQQPDPSGLQKECEAALQRAGFEVRNETASLVFTVRIFGVARSENYTWGRHYSGADVTIDAAIARADSPSRTIAAFSTTEGSVDPPSEITSNYPSLADAPYAQACQACDDFYSQFLSLIAAVKGPEAVQRVWTADETLMQGHVLPFIRASGDKAYVPVLVDQLLTRSRWTIGEIADFLGELGDSRAVEPLCMVLVDDEGVVDAVATALGRLGDKQAIPSLRAALMQAHVRPESVATALRALDWHPESAQERVRFGIALNELDGSLE